MSDLLTRAKEIKNATEIGENTAERVGGVMVDMVESIMSAEESLTAQDAQIDELKKRNLAEIPVYSGVVESATIKSGSVTQYSGVYFIKSEGRFAAKQGSEYFANWLAYGGYQAQQVYHQDNKAVPNRLYNLIALSGGGLHYFDGTSFKVVNDNAGVEEAIMLLRSVMGGNAQVIEWSHTHNMNDYKEAGTYRIKGERTGNPMDDNLPIMNSGSGHTIEGILYVLDSSLTNGSGKEDDFCITQFLMLSNRVGGQEGDMYMRSAYGANKDNLTWKPWEKYQTNMEVGVVSNDATHEPKAPFNPINTNGLNSFVDNGIYSGVYLTQEVLKGDDTKAQTFVMVVINNYAAAGDYKTVTQIKFAVTNAGEYSMERRRRGFDGKWSGWINEYNDLSARIDEKAPKVGYAPDLKVNFAKELVGRGEATPQVIGKIRPTGEISIGDGNATIEKIKGNSVVWTQIVKDWKTTHAGITIVHDGAKATINGTTTDSYICFCTSNVIPAGHKGLIRLHIIKGDDVLEGLRFGFVNKTNVYNIIKDGCANAFYTNDDTFSSYLAAGIQAIKIGVEFHDVVLTVNSYDLTKMFGAGNEPTTIEEFEARKPLGVTDEYNEGEIISYDGANALQSIGFNAYNGDYANVIGGQKYHALGNITSIGFAKEMGGETTEVTLDSDGMFTPTEDGYVYAEGTDICIHLAHTYTPEHTTEYEADTLQLPNIKSIKDKDGNPLFPYGLLSAGSAHDEITATKAIKRIGVVDLGSLNWRYGSANVRFVAPYSAFKVIKINQTPNSLSSELVGYSGIIFDSAKDVTKIYRFDNDVAQIYVRHLSYTDATTFKQAMQGVLLYYELAEPIEVDLEEPLNLTYEAWDFGTEELHTGAKTTPLNADISYQFNAVDRIRENTTKASDLEARVLQLEAMLTQMAQANNEA